MPMPIMSFRPLTFEDMNPGVDAANHYSELMRGFLENRNTAIKNKYAPKTFEEQIKQMQLANMVSEKKMPYVVPRETAEIEKLQAEAPNLRASTALTNEQTKYYGPKSNAEMALQYSSANKNNIESKFTPLKYSIEAANAGRQNSRFGAAYQFGQALKSLPSAAARDAYAAAHPQEMNDYINAMGNNLFKQEADPLQQVMQRESERIYGAMPNNEQGGFNNPQQQGQPQGQQMPQAQQEPATLQDQMMNFFKTMTGQQGAQPGQQSQNSQAGPFQNSEEAVRNTQLASQVHANKSSVTAAMNNRADNAIAFEIWLRDNREEYSRRMKNIMQYSGTIGKGKNWLDKLAVKSPEAYQDFLWFKKSFVGNAANQVKLMEKMGATDDQREELHGMLDAVDRIDLDPIAALKLTNKLIGTTQDISRSVLKASQPLYPGVREQMANLNDDRSDYIQTSKGNAPAQNAAGHDYTDEDYEYTAKQEGISVDELKKRYPPKRRGS